MTKILLFDIETSFNIAAVWRCGYNINVDTHQILKERQIICISWKWHGESEIWCADWGVNDQSDKKLLKEFSRAANKADIVVTQNGDRFDIPWVQGRLLINGLAPLPMLTSIDTLKLNRKTFNLNSYKLDYMSKLLGRSGKMKMEFNDWVEIIMNKSNKHLNKMLEYNMKDVEELEFIFNKIRPYVQLPVRLYHSAGCPNCHSGNVFKNGTRTTKTKRYHRMCCKACGYSWKGEVING